MAAADSLTISDFVYNKSVEFNILFWQSYDNLIPSPGIFDIHPWIMAMIGSVIVGLSGIFPLLIIPIDETATLKNGAGAKTLRILLSFAVGGLLGDVFLHLLPEAWGNHYIQNKDSKLGNPSLFCGLWVLAGLLVFIIIEKIFSFEKEDPAADETEKVKTMPIRRKKSSFVLNDLTCGRKDGICCRTILKNNAAANDNMMTVTNNNIDVKNHATPTITTNPEKKNVVQVSGYLNLMANSIDNFTHGLAVGGSFLLSTRVGLLTTFAILVHEIPHEVGDFAILLRAGFTRWDAAWAQVYTASAGIAGALTALVFSASTNSIEARTTWILPFTAGGFLHIALVTVLPELLEEKNLKESLKQMCSLASGITVMALLTALVEN